MSKNMTHGKKSQEEKNRIADVDQSRKGTENDTVLPDSEAITGQAGKPVSDAEPDDKAAPEVERVKEDLGAKLALMEAEISNLKDQYLRKAAEFENFRKRMNKEKLDAIDFANQSLLLDLIPVIDDFERAIKSSEAGRDYDSLHEGIGLIEKRLVTQLENKWGLVRFESQGQPFDPNKHEAVMMEKTAEVSEPMVSEDFLKGYTLKERVIRSAKVKVLMPLDEGAEEQVKSTETADSPAS